MKREGGRLHGTAALWRKYASGQKAKRGRGLALRVSSGKEGLER
jgi:hypothetical protein